ncbi:hypothetical protein CEP54_012685 [Fusarium duplospermum]|uniref:Uncharacterized protein n=1 Tax=Fusarium duplospermum TaxID=1325734 RepID=A0A428P774_9HYPO|nr:hypothetical protein CEP54_012685 [Fusarium duplospermum]
MPFGNSHFRVKTRAAQAVFASVAVRRIAMTCYAVFEYEEDAATRPAVSHFAENELAEAQSARNSNPLYHEAFHQLMAEQSPSPG